MFEKWKEKMVRNKVNKLNKLPVFHQSMAKAHLYVGTYRNGKLRPFDILLDNTTKESMKLHDVQIMLNENQDLVVTGNIKDENQAFTRIWRKDDIKWRLFHHFFHTGLDEHLNLCTNPNMGTLDIILQNGDTLLIHYTVDAQKEKQLVVS